MHWYRDLAAHLGSAYLRYAFTFGTAEEVDFLVDTLRLEEGMRVLDVGCGPGRHSVEMARRRLDVVGVDISPEFLAVARDQARKAGVHPAFFEGDAADLPFEDEFDGVVCICEGGFGLGIDDLRILRSLRRALRPGAALAVSAPNLLFVMTHMPQAEIDPVRLVFHETRSVIGEDGTEREFEMWNSCYTPRELEWIANGAGLDPEVVYGIEPGAYAQVEPGIEHPELMLIARKPPPRRAEAKGPRR